MAHGSLTKSAAERIPNEDPKITLSFCILDDLSPIYGPITVELDDFAQIRAGVVKILRDYKNQVEYDKSGYMTDKTSGPSRIYEITDRLHNEDYYVENAYDKYYCICFSINYTRFEVFSKGCKKRLIKWREDDFGDRVTGILEIDGYSGFLSQMIGVNL